jgi:hypothetical protein
LSSLVDFAATYVEDVLQQPEVSRWANATVQNVSVPPQETVVPFVFYILGLVQLSGLIVSIPVVYCADNFALPFHLALSLGAFLSLLIASAMLTASAHGLNHDLTHGAGAEYVANAKIPEAFVGATWGGAFGSLFGGAILLLDWEYEVKLSGRRLNGLIRVRRRRARVSAGDEGSIFQDLGPPTQPTLRAS